MLGSYERADVEPMVGDNLRVARMHPGAESAAPKPIVQRNGTGIAADEVSDEYVSEAKSVISDEEWRKRTPQARTWDLIGLASKRLEGLGMPRITGERQDFTDGTNAAFMPAVWFIQVAESSVADNRTSEQRGRLVGAVYHEARHAEQYFRVAAMLARKGKTANEIEADLKLAKYIATAAAKVGAEEGQKKKPKEGTPAALEAKKRQQEEERWHQSMGLYEEMTRARKGIDDEYTNASREWLLNPRDIAAFKRYQIAWDQRRQAYIMYQKTAVEADAWDTQGRVEKKLGLSAHGLEAELQEMARHTPDPRQARPVEREGPQERAVGNPSVSLGVYLNATPKQTTETPSSTISSPRATTGPDLPFRPRGKPRPGPLMLDPRQVLSPGTQSPGTGTPTEQNGDPTTAPTLGATITSPEPGATTGPDLPFRPRAKPRPGPLVLDPRQVLSPGTQSPGTGTPTDETDDLKNVQLKRIQRHPMPSVLEEVVADARQDEKDEKGPSTQRR